MYACQMFIIYQNETGRKRITGTTSQAAPDLLVYQHHMVLGVAKCLAAVTSLSWCIHNVPGESNLTTKENNSGLTPDRITTSSRIEADETDAMAPLQMISAKFNDVVEPGLPHGTMHVLLPVLVVSSSEHT